MAFTLPNFVGQTYTPDYSGIGDAVQNYYQGKIAPSDALIEQIKAQFAQPNAQADLDKTRLENIGQQIKNAFAPATSEADIALKNQMAKMYGIGGGGRGGVDLQTLNATQNEVQNLNPHLNASQLDEAQTAYRNGINVLSDGTILNPPSDRLNTLMGITYKRSTDVAQRNQSRFASTLDSLFPEADKNADDAFSFAGGIGKLKEGSEAIKSQFGKESPAYDNYQVFKNTQVPTIVSEMVRTSGANSTDAQKAMALGAAISTNLGTNPKIAKQSWTELKKLYGTIGKTISQTPIQQRQTFTSGAGSAGFVEGKIYTDAKGNKARFTNGQWEEI